MPQLLTSSTLLPAGLAAIATRQEFLLDRRQCLRCGVNDDQIRHRVRTGKWTRPTRGVVDVRPVPARDGASTDLAASRRRAAWLALLALGRDAVAVGSCALALLGVSGLPARIRPEAATPTSGPRASRDGVVARYFEPQMTTVLIDGRRVASPRWAIAQAVPELPRWSGLAVLDAVLREEILDDRGLEIAHAIARGRRGVASRHDLWEHACGLAESPLESAARLDCIDWGVPPHRLQLPVHGSTGRVEARADMAWRLTDGRWLVAEVDGREFHDAPSAAAADRRRQNRLVGGGRFVVLRFTSRDLPDVVGRTVREVLAAHDSLPVIAP